MHKSMRDRPAPTEERARFLLLWLVVLVRPSVSGMASIHISTEPTDSNTNLIWKQPHRLKERLHLTRFWGSAVGWPSGTHNHIWGCCVSGKAGDCSFSLLILLPSLAWFRDHIAPSQSSDVWKKEFCAPLNWCFWPESVLFHSFCIEPLLNLQWVF